MNYSENISITFEKNEVPNSKVNFLHEGLSDNHLLPSNDLLNKKIDKDEKKSIKNIINSNNTSSRNRKKKENDFYSIDNSILLSEEKQSKEKEKMKKKKVKEKRYIVDNIDNIISKLSKPKIKLVIQEFMLYAIVLTVCIYYWIFLFLTTTRFEQSYCYSNLDQFDSCSFEQICNYYDERINILIYNHTYNSHNDSIKNQKELLVEENRLINEYYRPFFLRYYELLMKNKIFTKIQMNSISEKINFAIFMIEKEKWNVFYRYFVFCNFENYYIMILIMIGIGGILGSIFFGLLADIFGRRTIIRVTLLISTISTFLITGFFGLLDYLYYTLLKEFKSNYKIIGNDPSYINILSYIYAQHYIGEKFNKYFIFLLISICLLNSALWPLLKSCMSLLVENSKGDVDVLISFRKYNFVFAGLPPLFTSLIFPNINNCTLTFLILGIFNLLAFIYSCLFFEESIRYYYEYCEWKQLTQTILNLYKNDISDFRNINELGLKKFIKEENLKNFNNTSRKMSLFIKSDNNDNSIFVIRNTYYNNFVEKNTALNRNIRRNIDFVIKLDDVKSNPFLIITSLLSNNSFKKSQILIFIILILLYIVLDLYQKELLEPPYYTIKDLYLDKNCNYIINSIFFAYLIINFLSNLFFYLLYRINCFNTVIYIALIFIAINCAIYHKTTTSRGDTLMDVNIYNLYMLTYYNRDTRSVSLLTFIFFIFFALNGVLFYIYLLILKISKTIYRNTFLAIHSISIIISILISETIYFNMEDYFLFLGSLIMLSFLTFSFLGDFKELLYVMDDLKIDIFRPSKNKQEKEKIN